jgi:cyclic pyranopterin phosphate synthase
MEGEALQSGAAKEMTAAEIIRIVKIAVELGISRVKLTGGEPLVREDITQIVRGIADLSGLTDLSMTTNGTSLSVLAEELYVNGLKRVNVTLPTLDRVVYSKLTGGSIEPVLEGVKVAVKAGFCPVKLNMLILRDENDDAIPEMMQFAADTGAVLQLIELEPLNVSGDFYSKHHKPLGDYEKMLGSKATAIETRRFMQNRHVYRLPNVRVETIQPTENAEFCEHCTRLRVTSDGKLKPCLMTNNGLVDLLTPMRNGASDEELTELFKLANLKRQPYNKR